MSQLSGQLGDVYLGTVEFSTDLLRPNALQAKLSTRFPAPTLSPLALSSSAVDTLSAGWRLEHLGRRGLSSWVSAEASYPQRNQEQVPRRRNDSSSKVPFGSDLHGSLRERKKKAQEKQGVPYLQTSKACETGPSTKGRKRIKADMAFSLKYYESHLQSWRCELQMPVREHVMTAVAEGRKAVGKRLSKETISSSFPNYSYGSPCSMDGLSDNQTWVREFILLGLSSDWDTQVALFVLFSVTYLLTLLGNVLIVLLIRLDSRLHTPMYFFLTNLSLVDVSYATSIVPQMLVHFLAERKGIPYVSCAARLFFSLGLGGIEFVLLAVMAYDRYVAVCDPLRYSVIMHGGLCARLAVTSWVSGSVNSLVQTTITFQLPMCMNKYIDHISCEILAVVRLACVDTSSNEVAIMVSSIV
ncbi:hypothetical protein ABFV05_003006 [Capra hircus]